MLVRLLQDSNNDGARQALSSLRAQRELGLARIRARSVVAPRAGIIGNVRVRQGQSGAPGEIVMTLGDEGTSSYSVAALPPRPYRPILNPGRALPAERDGYAHA